MNHNIASAFYRHSLKTPEALALFVDNREYTYGELAHLAQHISCWLQKNLKRRPQRVGILASRSMEAIAAVLGINWAGGTYVPISLKLPQERLCAVLELAELDALIVDTNGAAMLSGSVLKACPPCILIPDEAAIPAGEKQIFRFRDLPTEDYAHAPVEINAEDLSYIIFTSGTTGVPKGVEISFGNIDAHVRAIQHLYALVPDDKVAQISDLSFDIAISNIWTAWNIGAGLYIVPQTQVMAPAAFIRDRQITVWFSVPSIVHFLQSLKLLKPGAFPSLRCSIFAGEALPIPLALAWKAAAPNSTIDNTYGPTEGTVVCVGQRLPAAAPFPQRRDIVALGKAFPGSKIAVVDDALRFLPPEEPGELALAGAQIAMGYFRSPEFTAARFPTINGERWYLTGDQGVQDADGIYYHLGRRDNQVKVLGYRVELEDIEAHLRAVCDLDVVAAVAWPVSHGIASGIVGFVTACGLEPARIRELLKDRLPPYMVPGVIHVLSEIPLTANGKIDRKQLLVSLEKLSPPS
jgi:amino acid adenylation domain-containing protein